MGRSGIGRAQHLLIWIVKISGDNPGTETKAANGIDKKNREIATRPSTTSKRLLRRLGILVFTNFVADPRGDTGTNALLVVRASLADYL